MALVSNQASTAEYTVADLHAMPDDGRRRELIDGMLFVTPAPGWPHQEMGLALYRLLHAACPPELHVLAAPFGVTTSEVDEVQPDVLVARFADLTRANRPVAPVMVAEVASRSTRLHDRNTKKAHYERLGVASYWLLDPDGAGGPDGQPAMRSTASRDSSRHDTRTVALSGGTTTTLVGEEHTGSVAVAASVPVSITDTVPSCTFAV
ncbi:Uma2 family endonuclease [Actinomycetospora sp. C-140]